MSPDNGIARRDRALRRLRRITATIAAVAVVSAAGVSALAATTAPGTSKPAARTAQVPVAPPSGVRPRATTAAAARITAPGVPTARPTRPDAPAAASGADADAGPAAAGRRAAARPHGPAAGAHPARGHLRRLMSTAFSTTTLQAIGTTAVVVVRRAVRVAGQAPARRRARRDRPRVQPLPRRLRADARQRGRRPRDGDQRAVRASRGRRAARRRADRRASSIPPSRRRSSPWATTTTSPRCGPMRPTTSPACAAAGWRTVELDRAAPPAAPRAGLPPRPRRHGQGAGRRPRRGGHRRRDGIADARQPRRRRRDRRARSRRAAGSCA